MRCHPQQKEQEYSVREQESVQTASVVKSDLEISILVRQQHQSIHEREHLVIDSPLLFKTGSLCTDGCPLLDRSICLCLCLLSAGVHHHTWQNHLLSGLPFHLCYTGDLVFNTWILGVGVTFKWKRLTSELSNAVLTVSGTFLPSQ